MWRVSHQQALLTLRRLGTAIAELELVRLVNAQCPAAPCGHLLIPSFDPSLRSGHLPLSAVGI
jgi:hypothetical protein